jgi:hypothetical protein
MASIIKANQLQDFGGNSIITSDGAGNLTTQKTNYPAFYGRLASSQTLSRGVDTKITPFTTNEIDTDNAFNGTAFTVPSGKAGKYFFTSALFFNFESSGNDGEVVRMDIYKNGSSIMRNQLQHSGSGRDIKYYSGQLNLMVDAAVSDYFEIYGYMADSSASGTLSVYSPFSYFQGYRIGS